MRLLLASVLIPTLLCTVACHRSGAGATTLARTVAKAVASQPELVYRVVAFEAGTSTLEVSMKSTPGTQNVFLDISSIELGGTAPAEPLPLVLGPVAGGEDARALLHFTNVPWEFDTARASSRSTTAPVRAAFAYRIRTYFEGPDAASEAEGTSSQSSLSMPVWVDADSPVHAQIAQHLAAKR